MPQRRLKRQITDQAGDLGDYLREETTGGRLLLAANREEAPLLGDFRLLGMRPSVVVADDERSVVLAERRA